MNFSFALVSLFICCAAVAVVYALTGSEDPEKWSTDTIQGFLVMFGGVFLLGVVVYAMTWSIGS